MTVGQISHIFVANRDRICDIENYAESINLVDFQLLKIIFLKIMGVLIFYKIIKNNLL